MFTLNKVCCNIYVIRFRIFWCLNEGGVILFDSMREDRVPYGSREEFRQKQLSSFFTYFIASTNRKSDAALRDKKQGIKVVERFEQAKKKDGISDDAIFVGDNFAAVIDGVSSRSERLEKFLNNGKTTGSMASALLVDAVSKFPINIDKDKAVDLLTEKIAKFYKDNNVYNDAKNNPCERLAATAVIYSKHRGEVWMIGDCQCMIDDKLYTNTMAVDDVVTAMRAYANEIELRKGRTVKELLQDDVGKKLIAPFIKEQKIFENANFDSKFSYVDINGFPVNKDFVKVIKVPEDAKQIVLASDGYPELKPTLEETEKTLKEIIEEDPLCIKRHKATKGVDKEKGYVSFDDRTYLRIVLD